MVVPCRGGLSHAQEGFVMQRRAVPCKEGCPMHAEGGLTGVGGELAASALGPWQPALGL